MRAGKCTLSDFRGGVYFLDERLDTKHMLTAKTQISYLSGMVTTVIEDSSIIVSDVLQSESHDGKRVITRFCLKQLLQVGDHECGFTHFPVPVANVHSANIKNRKFVVATKQKDVTQFIQQLITRLDGIITDFWDDEFWTCTWITTADGPIESLNIVRERKGNIIDLLEFMRQFDTNHEHGEKNGGAEDTNPSESADMDMTNDTNDELDAPVRATHDDGSLRITIIDNYIIARGRNYAVAEYVARRVAVKIGFNNAANFHPAITSTMYPLQDTNQIFWSYQTGASPPLLSGEGVYEIAENSDCFFIRGAYFDLDKHNVKFTARMITNTFIAVLDELGISGTKEITTEDNVTSIFYKEHECLKISMDSSKLEFTITLSCFESLMNQFVLHSIIANPPVMIVDYDIGVEASTSNTSVINNGFPVVMFKRDGKTVFMLRKTNEFYIAKENYSMDECISYLLKNSDKCNK